MRSTLPAWCAAVRKNQIVHQETRSVTRYVIVGMGVAGITAAATLRTQNPSAEIIIVGDDAHGFYSRPGLAYSLNDEIPENSLYLLSKKDWRDLKLSHVIKGNVTRLDPVAHQIEVDSTGSLAYDRLLLATGSSAVRLKVPGENLVGMVKLDTFEDARRILSLTRRARTAVVVGGGIIAVEMAEGLVAQKVKVHYLLRGNRYWANVLDEAESHFLERRLVHHGVSLHYQTEVAKILGRGGKVEAVQTTKNEIISCKLVAVGVGVRSRIDLAKSAGLKTDRGILTNEYLQTSDVDIFAAGDAAQIFDLATRRSSIDTLWNPAREQGRIAAENMAGKQMPYYRSVAVNVVRLAGVMISIIGAVGSGHDDDLVNVARGSSETWLQLPNTIAMESGNDLSHLRLMVGERTLLGALVMGDQKLSLPLQEMISARTDITSIRSQLLQSGDMLGQIIMDFWTTLRVEEKITVSQ
jgi:NAD(P)H-nitrite reductase large subunit